MDRTMRSIPAPETFLANLTEAQREAVLHTEGPLLILAGPGSGKTRTIAARLARACSYGSMRERRDVLVGALQSEREEETRD